MKSSLRILYLEDDKNDVELVREKLEEEGFLCDIVHVETKTDFIAAIEKGGFDLILSDYNLPAFDGLSALAIARISTPEIPFLFLSGVMGEELAIETLKNGATDYVLKQRLSRLVPAIQRALKEAEEHLERMNAEKALKSLSRQNELILNSASEGILGLDVNGDHTFVNSAAAQMLGYRVKDLIGKHSHKIWHHSKTNGSPYPEEECPIYAVCKYGIVRRVKDEVFWRKDGTSFPVAYTSTPILESGKLIGAVVTFRDITNRKREEETLRKYRQDLKKLVEERTTELTKTNDELQLEIAERRQAEETVKQMADELKRSNADLQQFAFTASHDLQEPLRGIECFTKLLEKRYKGKLDEKADEYIDYVVDDVQRMQMLIKDLLEYSRVSVKEKIFCPVNCSVVLEQALKNLRLSIDESRADVTYDLLPVVVGDEAQLIRLFQNLIGNAIKFRGWEPLKIHISARREGAEWVFSIRDNSIGIDPGQAERIFVIFQRLHPKQEYPGTGVGLAICKRIVERHGGRIWVESEAGKGATFYFTITDSEVNPSEFQRES